MVNIRQATTQDIEQIIVMCEALHSESEYYRNQLFEAERLAESLNTVMGNEYHIIFLAEQDKQIIGFFIGGLTRGLFNYELIAFDYSVYVVPEKRNGRAAIKLIKAFEQWAKEKGANRCRIGITTDISTNRTSRFYQLLGFKPCGVSFEKVINHGC